MLASYYFMTINLGWKENKIKGVEKYLHGIPLLWGFGTAIVCLALNLYSDAKLWCWLGNDTKSVRIERYALFYGPVMVTILYTTIIMINIYRFVRAREKANEKYDISHNASVCSKNSGAG